MNIIPGSLREYIRRLERKEPFGLARYGDGEFASILGMKGQNCDGVAYTPELQQALQNTLFDTQEDMDYGMLAVAMKFFKPYIIEFHLRHELDINWVEATFLVAANRHGKLNPLIRALQDRRILYVGPKHLRGAGQFLPIKSFIEVHPSNAFANWKRDVERVVDQANEVDLIGISAGPTANVMVHALWKRLGGSHTIVDFGSIWDGYVGRPSRKYMKRSTWNDLARENLQDAYVIPDR